MAGDCKRGPACPFCKEHNSRVVDSRWHLPAMTKRRTRECVCGERFYTEERALNLRITKRTTIRSGKSHATT
jgi:transcriptional regulator NrdR family protein